MKNENQETIERIIQLRKQIAILENKIAQYETDVPGELFKEFVETCRWFDDEEQKVRAASAEKSKQVNIFREKIIEKLQEYNQWLEQMREFEALFLAYIVRPGYRLKQAVHQREYLTKQYKRISRSIETAKYTIIEELNEDIHDVLSFEDDIYEEDQENMEDYVQQEKNPYEDLFQFDVNDLIEEFQKESLVRDFKRIVLPANHPDTSEAETDEFIKVFAIFKNRDYLLMEAYIAQHKGDVEMDLEKDPVEGFEEICEYQEQYQKLNARLEKRIKQIKKDMISKELEKPDQLREKLLRQQEEIRKRIQDEGEKILELREKIKNLSQNFLENQTN